MTFQLHIRFARKVQKYGDAFSKSSSIVKKNSGPRIEPIYIEDTCWNHLFKQETDFNVFEGTLSECNIEELIGPQMRVLCIHFLWKLNMFYNRAMAHFNK